jgi:DNA-binding CsgD family transcriptional regulator
MSIGRSERLVGRESELAAFRDWLTRAGRAPGGAYVIAGEPGVGKSRLAGEAVTALPASWLVTRGRATDRDRPAPFRPVAEALLAASRHRPLPDDPDVIAGVRGHAYGLYALLREDRAAAHDALDRAAEAAGRATGMHGLFWGPWALVSLLESPADRPADTILGRLDQGLAGVLPVNRGLVGYAQAVAAGQASDGEQAGLLVNEAERVLAGQPAFGLWRHLCRRLAAEAALRDGWGDPVSWLRECLAAFDSGGHQQAATACRVLLSRAGATVPRRSGAAASPDLAALGVTAREADVLKLVADGLSNREIGERLFLSPRTVEKHVERLLAKTGAHNRSQPVARAARWRTALCT